MCCARASPACVGAPLLHLLPAVPLCCATLLSALLCHSPVRLLLCHLLCAAADVKALACSVHVCCVTLLSAPCRRPEGGGHDEAQLRGGQRTAVRTRKGGAESFADGWRTGTHRSNSGSSSGCVGWRQSPARLPTPHVCAQGQNILKSIPPVDCVFEQPTLIDGARARGRCHAVDLTAGVRRRVRAAQRTATRPRS